MDDSTVDTRQLGQERNEVGFNSEHGKCAFVPFSRGGRSLGLMCTCNTLRCRAETDAGERQSAGGISMVKLCCGCDCSFKPLPSYVQNLHSRKQPAAYGTKSENNKRGKTTTTSGERASNGQGENRLLI